MSQTTARDPGNSRASASAFAASMSKMMMGAPAAENARLVASPMPLAPRHERDAAV